MKIRKKMEVGLVERKPQTPASVDNKMLRQQEENFKTTTSAAVAKTEFTINDNDDSALLASLPKAEVKIRKFDETKLLMDNNENSLSVDSLIEILSSNETSNKLPASNDKGMQRTLSAPSTLSSPSSSSSSKAGLSDSLASPGPSPSSGFAMPKMFPSPHHLNGGKPMISDMNKKMKQVAKRQPKPKAVYQSQISDNAIGIKLCIKKSVNSKKKSLPSQNNNNNNIKSPSKKRSGKSRAKGHESDSDDAYVKRRKKTSSASNNNTKTPSDEPVEQSGWGKQMPKEILFDVS